MISAKAKKDDKLQKRKIEKDRKDSLNNHKSEIACEICEQNFDSHLKMKVHIKLDHLTDNHSQTEEVCKEFEDKNIQVNHCLLKAIPEDTQIVFKEYPCFYCGKSIASVVQLQNHSTLCHSTFLQVSSKSEKFQQKIETPVFKPTTVSHHSHLGFRHLQT